MKRIPLSQSGYGRPAKERAEPLFALVDDDDYEWLNQWKWTATFPNGRKSGYAVRTEYSQTILMHRLIVNAPPDRRVDHRNRNGFDNQRDNLRFATPRQNTANRSVNKNNKSGYKGVIRNTQKGRPWKMSFVVTTDTPEEAARIYDRIVRLIHGEFAVTNFND